MRDRRKLFLLPHPSLRATFPCWEGVLSIFLFFFLNVFAYADQLIVEPDAGRAPLLSAIAHANSSIDLVMYGFTDENFMSALINAKNQGKNVRVLLEAPTPYKADDENARAIQEFRVNKVTLAWPNKFFKLTHQKTFVLDQKYALVLTFNLTHSSFSKERNFALVVTDPAMVQEIATVFAADWQHKLIAVHHPNLAWSPQNSREKILDFIQSANQSLQIYAQDISDYKVVGALAKAARRGVQVDICTSRFAEQQPSKKILYLQRAGVKIHNNHNYVIHAKVILVDHKRALIGSINLTKASLDNNRELSVFTDDPKVIHTLTETFERDTAEGRSFYRNQYPTVRQVVRIFKHVYRELF